MKGAGWLIFGGMTLLMSALDGGVSLLLLATAAAAGTYNAAKSDVGRPELQTLEHIYHKARVHIATMTDDAQKEKASLELEKWYREAVRTAQTGHDFIAKLYAVGVFACPLAGIGLAASRIRK